MGTLTIDPMQSYVEKCYNGFMYDNQTQALQWAYFAGLFDGEGSFCVTKTSSEKTQKATKRKNPAYGALIRIGMTQYRAIKDFYHFVNRGNLYFEGVRKDRTNVQPMYRYVCTNRQDIIYIIEHMIPFIRVKKEQAQVLLQFCKDWKSPFNRQLGIDSDELQRREDAHKKMHKLNAYGAAATTKPRSIREDEAIV